jgi:hypothetical protein
VTVTAPRLRWVSCLVFGVDFFLVGVPLGTNPALVVDLERIKALGGWFEGKVESLGCMVLFKMWAHLGMLVKLRI